MVNSSTNININQRSSSTLSGNRKKIDQRSLTLRTNIQASNANNNSVSELTQTADQNNSLSNNNTPNDKEAKDVSSPHARLAYKIFGATDLKVPKEMFEAKIRAESRRLQNEGVIAAGWLEGSKQVGAIVKAGVDTIVGAAVKIANVAKQSQG